jgi:hypothetical protein
MRTKGDPLSQSQRVGFGRVLIPGSFSFFTWGLVSPKSLPLRKPNRFPGNEPESSEIAVLFGAIYVRKN